MTRWSLAVLSIASLLAGTAAATRAEPPALPVAIVVAAEASPAERNAADQLQRFLGEIYRTRLEVVAEPVGGKDHIFVGPSRWTAVIDPEPLGTDGITIQTRGRDLILLGGRPRGTLNAVFTFLQDPMGCRWYATDEELIPRRTLPEGGLSEGLRSLVGDLSITYVPPFAHRQYFGPQTQDVEFAARNRLNGRNWQTPMPEEWGGGVSMARPSGGHTLLKHFLKPADHFASHPEWFAWRKDAGKHQPVQPCMTHPEVKAQVVKEVLAYLDEQYPTWGPGPKIVSISNADNDTYCECERCGAVYEREGSQSGALLQLVNAVAGEVAGRYPDVLVSTLAYWMTAAPPKTVRAEPNVLIHLGTMQRDHKVPVNQTKYGDYLKRWRRIARQVYIWDYDTNYHNYMRPHPSYYAVPQSLKFFHAQGVTGVFVQGGWGKPELHNLRAWVNAQLLWDPRGNPRELVAEFVQAYYGDAAEYVLEYMDVMEHAVRDADGKHLSVYGKTDNWLTLSAMNHAQKLVTQARAAVQGDERRLPRVLALQMCLDMIWLERYAELRRAAEEGKLPFEGPDDPIALLDEYASNPLNVSTMREGKGGNYGQFLEKLRTALTAE